MVITRSSYIINIVCLVFFDTCLVFSDTYLVFSDTFLVFLDTHWEVFRHPPVKIK